jgi:hypothetical protein
MLTTVLITVRSGGGGAPGGGRPRIRTLHWHRSGVLLPPPPPLLLLLLLLLHMAGELAQHCVDGTALCGRTQAALCGLGIDKQPGALDHGCRKRSHISCGLRWRR